MTACILGVLACAGSTPSPAPESSRPVIERIEPTSGPAGTAYPIRLTIEGRFFADSTNVIHFGPVTLERLSSSNSGTRIELYAPKEQPSGGEVPPMVLQPGRYEITVSTAAGRSNAIPFTLTREPF